MPDTSGFIIPNHALNAHADPASMRGSMTINAGLTVQGNITEEVFPKVQAMMERQMAALPGMIDARVIDGQTRGRL